MSSQKHRRTKKKQKLSTSSSLRVTSLALDTDFTEMKLEDFTTAKSLSQLRSSKSMQKVGDVPKDGKKKQKARVPTTTEIEIKVNKTNKVSKKKKPKANAASQENKSSSETRTSRISTASRQSEGSRNSRESRVDSKASKASTKSKMSENSKESKESKKSKESKESKESRVSVESKNKSSRESRLSLGSQASHATRMTRASLERLQSRGSRSSLISISSRESYATLQSRSSQFRRSSTVSRQIKAYASAHAIKSRATTDSSQMSTPRKTNRRMSPMSPRSLTLVEVTPLRKAKKSEKVVEEAKPKPVEEEEEDILHFDDTSETSQVDTIEYVEETEDIAIRRLMMEMLTMPDINELSETSLPITPKEEEVQQIKEVKEKQIQPQLEIEESLETEDAEEADEEEESDKESISFAPVSHHSLSFLNLSSLSSSEHTLFMVPSPQDNESMFSTITQQLNAVKVRGSQVDFVEASELESRNLIKSICLQFMEEAITRTVAMCEAPSRKLLQRLDKLKMWKKLRKLFIHITDESAVREKLLKWTTEHFLRKKRYVFIRKSKKKFDEINYQRFHSALVELDRQLEIEQQTSEKTEFQISKLKQQHIEREEYCNRRLREFESIVRETLLHNDSFAHLTSSVDNLLTTMSKVRNEVSDLRLELLYAQHRFADMIIKSEELEDLGDGLKMREFLIRQADTQVLTLKIEERNSDLNRLHTKCNDDVHALAHLKNKEHMWRHTHERNVRHLQDCIDRNTKFREQIYRGKLEHNAISREISKLRFDGGLMQYPALLEDFDQTVSDLYAKRKSVEKLRNTHKSLLNRIRLAEQLADAVSRRKSIKSTGSIRKSTLLEAADLAKQLRISALSK
ncbi:coiled-coil domain-containing protein 96 isoform X1 [Drosophila albomicans]|uniref:Coiled-coil domain-containing protein 96 isoform X1 n=1 Tax=Drosophila albomicans TaxID=7291 RepID=A0A9C6WCK0_DROAB|nr:coiled-coil domain-containing protein 96 isoform X1 [Drosophila albomicans]